MNHRGTTFVTVTTGLMAVLAIVLMQDLPEKKYYPVKYVIAAGLIATSGFFAQPRRRMFLQLPEDEANYVPQLEKPRGRTFVPFREDGAKVPPQIDEKKLELIWKCIKKYPDWVPEGWVEIDLFEDRAFVSEKKQKVETDYKALDYRVHVALRHHQPISANFATIHLLVAIFLIPYFGITMPKGSWQVFDFFLCAYLICALVRIQRERFRPKFSLIRREFEEEEPFELLSTMGHHEQIRMWPTALVLLVVAGAFGVAGSKVYWNVADIFPGFVVIPSSIIFATVLLVYLLVGVQLAVWQRMMPVQNWILVGLVCFLAVCSFARKDSYDERHSRDYGDPNDFFEEFQE